MHAKKTNNIKSPNLLFSFPFSYMKVLLYYDKSYILLLFNNEI